MRRLRAGLIGSISAWLPSRRSTAHQRGASVATRDGHWRSARSTGAHGGELWIGMPDGCWALRLSCGVAVILGPLGGLAGLRPEQASTPRRGDRPLGECLAAAADKE